MRGQITVFIILGIVMLAGTGFLFMMLNVVQDSQLQTSLDQTQSKLFRSEGARIYIEDCLMDTLDEGLETLGRSGRLFYPYTRLDFQDGDTGILYETQPVFLAITYKESENPASYPCASSANAPSYCQWVSEDKAHFGSRQKITLDLIESDLEQYVKEDVFSCLQSIIEDSDEFTGQFESGEMSLDLQIESGGIVVTASYPFSMMLDGEELFELQDFDLFYPSNLYSFFNNAIARPLYSEARDVHYNYTADTLQQISAYQILGADLEISNQGQYNVYEFTTNQIHRDDTKELVYRFAIENRPPALEYISQAACLGYDYLILPDSRTFTNLSLNVSAYDPDGDEISYILTDGGLGLDIPSDFSSNPVLNQEIDVPDNVYEILVEAQNEYGSDAQTVRVKVGETNDFTVHVQNLHGEDVTQMSIEEPYFVTIKSQNSVLDSITVTVGDEERFFSWSGTEFCFVIPFLSSVSCDDISNYENNMYDLFTESVFTINEGTTNINLDYDESLCGETIDLSRGLSYDTYACVYKEVTNHPFPFPYHEIYLNSSGGQETRDNSPFNTTTACCNPDNTLAKIDTVCYESSPLCIGRLMGIERSFCDRGVTCVVQM